MEKVVRVLPNVMCTLYCKLHGLRHRLVRGSWSLNPLVTLVVKILKYKVSGYKCDSNSTTKSKEVSQIP